MGFAGGARMSLIDVRLSPALPAGADPASMLRTIMPTPRSPAPPPAAAAGNRRAAVAAAPTLPPVSDDPQAWRGSSALIDLSDPRLRIKVAALTQLSRTERDRALALHDWVKRMRLRRGLHSQTYTARQVLDAHCGFAAEKTTLLIALFRMAGFAARLRYVEVSGELVHGLAPMIDGAYRPLVELWIDERWVRLDTHLFDLPFTVAAKERLRREGRAFGYAVARDGHTIWNGRDDAWVGAVPGALGTVVLADLGAYADELGFLKSDLYRQRHVHASRSALWALNAPFMNRVIRELQREGASDSVPLEAPSSPSLARRRRP